jgi:hypothetical protein
MYKLSTYLVVPFFLPTSLYVRPTSMKWVTKMKPGSNSVEVHPQLRHNGHPVDDALVGAGSLGPPSPMCIVSTYLVVNYFPIYLPIYI